MKHLIFGAILCLLFTTPAVLATGKSATPKWQQVAPGVWKAQIGKPESLTLLGAAGCSPAIEGLKKLPEAVFPIDQKEIEASQWDWKTALRFPLALNELGVQYLKLGQTAKAVEVLKSAVKLSPDAFGPKLNLGIALLETKQYPDAEEQLRSALKLNTSLPTGHMYLGICLTRRNDYAAAEKELLLAVQESGNQLGMAQYYLGGLYWKKNDYPHAVEALEAYLKLTPNAPDADRVRATIKDLRTRIP